MRRTHHTDAVVFAQMVSNLQSYLSFLVKETAYGGIEAIAVCCEALERLHRCNAAGGMIVPYQAFYNATVCQRLNLELDYARWRAQPNEFTIVRHAFLLDADTKKRLLEIDASQQMAQHAQNALWRTLATMQLHESVLLLVVSRDHIVEDTLRQLHMRPREDMKKVLRVQFVGEEGVDEGGVRKEFFQLLLRELLDPKFNMFTHNTEQGTIWFSRSTLEEENIFELTGIICGLSIYNGILVDLPFPTALYKKLLRQPVMLDDLVGVDAALAKNLRYVLDYDADDIEEVLGLTFEVTDEFYGSVRTHELVPNGRGIPVTRQNRREYVARYVDHVLNTSIEKPFEAFRRGFMHVCGGSVLELFNPHELELIVVGSREYNFDDLEKVTQYAGGYHAEHPTVRMFWSVFHSLSLEQKRKVLQFTTGTDRVPILGLSKLQFIIQRAGDDPSRLPVAHTCYNIVDLPEYRNADVLRERLLYALDNTAGFGLV